MAVLFPDEQSLIPRPVAAPPLLPMRAAAPPPKAIEPVWQEGDPLPDDYVNVSPTGPRNPLQSLVTDPFQRGMLQQGNNLDALLSNMGLLDADQFAQNARHRQLEESQFPTDPRDAEIMQQISKAPDLATWAALTFGNPQVIAQKVSGMLPGMGASVAGGVVGGVGGAIMAGPVGAIIGTGLGTGLGSGGTEYAATILDTAMSDPRVAAGQMTLSEAFQDPALMQEARINGAQRGISVGVMDGVTGAFAGRLGKVVEEALAPGIGGRVLGTSAEATMQAAGGASGEAGAQLLDRGKIDSLGNVIDEAALEVAGGPIEAAVGMITRPKGEAALAEPARQEPGWIEGNPLPDDYAPVVPDVVAEADLAAPGVATQQEVDQAINVDLLPGQGTAPEVVHEADLAAPGIVAPPVAVPGAPAPTIETPPQIEPEAPPAPDFTAPEAEPPEAPPAAVEPPIAPPVVDEADLPPAAPVEQPPAEPVAAPEPVKPRSVTERPKILTPEQIGALTDQQLHEESVYLSGYRLGQAQKGNTDEANHPELMELGRLIGAERERRSAPKEPVAPAPSPTAEQPASVPQGRGRRDGTFETEKVFTPNGEQQIDTRFEVMDASQLQAAEGLDQPRDREGRPMLGAHVRDIAAKLQFERLYKAAELDRGAPLIDEGNTVLSGNGRRQAVELAKAEYPERYAAYRQALEDAGYDTAGLETPILVRRATSQFDRRQLAVQGNQPATSAMSPAEQATIDADKIDPGMLETYDAENAGGVSAAANREFIRKFREKVPAAEQNALVTAEGTLTPEGERRVQNAIVAKAYGDKQLVTSLAENSEGSAKLRGALSGAAAAWANMREKAPSWDVTADLVRAVRYAQKAINGGFNIDDVINQTDIENAQMATPVQADFARMLMDRNGKGFAGAQTVAERLRIYALAGVEAETGTANLMGDKLTPDEARRSILQAMGAKPAGSAPAPKPEAEPTLMPLPETGPPKKGAPQDTSPVEGGLFSRAQLGEDIDADDDIDLDETEMEGVGPLPSAEADTVKAPPKTPKPKDTGKQPGGTPRNLANSAYAEGAARSEQIWRDLGIDPDKAQNMRADQQLRLMRSAMMAKFKLKDIKFSSQEQGAIHPRDALDHMRDLYTNLAGMMYALSLPAEGIGMNGRLTLTMVKDAEYMAAYYPGTREIRLPRRSNSFAHEWGHAFDHFMQEYLDRRPVATRKSLSHFSMVSLMRDEGLDPAHDFDQAIIALMRTIYYENAEDIVHTILPLETTAQEVNTRGNPTPLAKKAQARLEEWYKGAGKLFNLPKTAYYDKAQRADPQEQYFSLAAELMARSFEAFTANEMEAENLRNEGVTMGDAAYQATRDRFLSQAYPKDDERLRIYSQWREVIDYARRENIFGTEAAADPDRTVNDPLQYEKQVIHESPPTVIEAVQAESQAVSKAFKAGAGKVADFAARVSDEEGLRNLASDMAERAKISAGSARSTLRNVWDYATYFFGTTRAVARQRIARARANPNRVEGQRDSAAFMEAAATMLMGQPGVDILQTPTLETLKNDTIKEMTKRLEAVLRVHGRGWELKAADVAPIYQRMLGDQAVELTADQEAIAAEFRRVMDDMYRRLRKAGHSFGFVRYGYLPRMLQFNLVQQNLPGFIDAAQKAYRRAFALERDDMTHKEIRDRARAVAGRLEPDDQASVLTEERKAFKDARKALTKALKGGDPAEVAEAEEAYQEARENLLDAMEDDWARISAEDWGNKLMMGSAGTFHQPGVGARIEKGRELPEGVEEDLKDFLETNPLNLVISYVAQAANTMAYDQTVGRPNGNHHFDVLLSRKGVQQRMKANPGRYNKRTVNGRIRIIKELTDAAVDDRYEMMLRQANKDGLTTPDDLDMLRHVYRNLTGVGDTSRSNNVANRAANFLYAYGTLRLLSRSVTTALVEPMAIYLRTGNAGAAIQTFIYYLSQVARGSKNAQEVRDWAAQLNLIASPLYDTFLHARLGNDSTLGSSQKILSKFMVGNWQTAITNAQVRATAMGGLTWLRDMIQQVDVATDAKRKAYLDAGVASELRELGVPLDRQEEFKAFIRDRREPPTPDEMATPVGQMFKHAMVKFTQQVIQHPSRADKPMPANSPFGRLAYHLTSFLYSFFANIHMATYQRAKRNFKNAKEAGYDGLSAFGLSAGAASNSLVLGFGAVFIAQLLTTTVREAVYNREQWEKHKKDRLTWLMSLAWSRTGALGPADVLKSSLDGIRYERDLTTLVTGPALASILGDVKAIATIYLRNAAGTTTTEANAAKSFYNLVMAPTLAIALTSINTAGPVGELARFSLLTYLTSNAAAKNFADMGGTAALDAIS